jgi:hypothetical protein
MEDCFGDKRCKSEECLRCFTLKGVEPLVTALDKQLVLDKGLITNAMKAMVCYSIAVRAFINSKGEVRIHFDRVD